MARFSPASQSFSLPNGIRTYVSKGPAEYWDVKFYPYLVEKDDPVVFAVAGEHFIHICQITNDTDQGLRFLATYGQPQDRQTEVHKINTCTWCYLRHEEPLLALAGENGLIQVIDPLTGRMIYSLVGHGMGTVNELVTHPKYPWIIASCSMDMSIRIWDLRKAQNPTSSSCVIICGHGFGHNDGLLSICWHDTGRYILSGGFDQKICVWTIPDLCPESGFWKSISKENRKRSSDEVHIIYYPHFSTTALHLNYVDRVAWFGDLVLSKSCSPERTDKDNRIVMWSITGFDSNLEPPPPETAPKTQEYLETRNGFMRSLKAHLVDDIFDHNDEKTQRAPYQKFIEFDCPSIEAFYMRFGLTKRSHLFPDLHDIITIGNSAGEILHWDLEQLLVGHDGNPDGKPSTKTPKPKSIASSITTNTKPQRSKPGPRRNLLSRSEMTADTMSSVSSVTSSARVTPDGREASTEATSSVHSEPLSSEIPRPDRKKYPLNTPYDAVKCHRKNATKAPFCARTATWSVCGKYCVVVGSCSVPVPGTDEVEVEGTIIVLDRPV